MSPVVRLIPIIYILIYIHQPVHANASSGQASSADLRPDPGDPKDTARRMEGRVLVRPGHLAGLRQVSGLVEEVGGHGPNLLSPWC